jgi:hypothetical protein
MLTAFYRSEAHIISTVILASTVLSLVTITGYLALAM